MGPKWSKWEQIGANFFKLLRELVSCFRGLGVTTIVSLGNLVCVPKDLSQVFEGFFSRLVDSFKFSIQLESSLKTLGDLLYVLG
jgi:hypothetical protein